VGASEIAVTKGFGDRTMFVDNGGYPLRITDR
jgi:hypothetical protein